MLIDGNRWTGGPTIDTDVCIVGTGIGGGTLVEQLGKRKARFVVVEAGAPRKSDSVGMDNVGRQFVMPVTRSIELGGTSNLWHGVLSPLDRADFETRPWVPLSGWPVSLDELMPHYHAASALMGVEHFEYFDEKSIPEVFAQQMAAMPFDRAILENKLFQQRLDIMRFKKVVRRVVGESEDRHCLYNTVALELEPGERRSSVGQLFARTTGGREIRVRAKTFILAAGALETPRLLLNSRKMGERGAGNHNDQVGRYLMDHPMGNLLQIRFKQPLRAPLYSDTKSSPAMKIKTGLLFTPAIQKREGLPNHCFYIRPSFVEGINDESERIKLSLLTLRDSRMTMGDFMRVLTHPNVVAQVLAYKTWLRVTYKFGDLFFLTEQVPNPDSRVSLSDRKDAFGYPMARVDWKVTSADLESMQRCFRVLTTEAFSSEHFSFTHKAWTDTGWEERYSSAAHHVGTARMAPNDRTGVVDASLRVFGVDNLYVCDGSVFATAGNVNNSLTISALAIRLDEHLARVT
jgi:choline dehydrogenase-like flavoprotein